MQREDVTDWRTSQRKRLVPTMDEPPSVVLLLSGAIVVFTLATSRPLARRRVSSARAAHFPFSSAIRFANSESGLTGSTKTICMALRIMRSGEFHSLPRFTSMLLVCFVSWLT